ncbi:hypothetical protein BDZ90DRAFT_52632 [Jaminaea rosea]|uniref:Uncharacterized protein n=1 Tax=Jaminaea rosea TaxID=1569628 RepID=A0A316UM28_9BASI|nr:hypothetical protein BDZ90DRAFT_52632 [Jaminaea rosea]PWN26342.1 hypothetical protein BDZ90DRAFT_52632 [Jaminaea rosea]
MSHEVSLSPSYSTANRLTVHLYLLARKSKASKSRQSKQASNLSSAGPLLARTTSIKSHFHSRPPRSTSGDALVKRLRAFRPLESHTAEARQRGAGTQPAFSRSFLLALAFDATRPNRSLPLCVRTTMEGWTEDNKRVNLQKERRRCRDKSPRCRTDGASRRA